ncbi:MAG TPA: DUF2142 domain-containing protein [Anaerolineales bacterium]|nr:DUF2142 domain-containing protein [Anaerolineales bacterium]
MPASINARIKDFHVSKVEVALLFLLLLFGIPMIVLIPPGAGYDEEDHLVRVWELSAFSFLPGQMSPQEMKYPTLFRDFAYRQQGSAGILDAEFWQRYSRASFYEYGFVRREINTKSVYSPPLLLPQALTLHILGRRLNLPALPVFYACRFASLLSYLLLVWLAIRSMPFGKWILLVLAITPMALFQVTTVSPDAISNGIAFLFIADSLRATRFETIGWKEFGYLTFLFFLLFLGKLNLIPLALLPFLLLPPARFTKKGFYIALLGTALLLFLVEMVGWYVIASAHSDPLMANDANPVAQLRYIMGHPFAFVQVIIKDLIANGWTYFQGWINGYGYYYWMPPQIVSILFLLSLGVAVLTDSTREQVDRKSRIAFLLVFVMGYLATVGAMYTTFTPAGSSEVFGVQGRYFIPLAVLLFLTLASFPRQGKLAAAPSRWTMIFLGVALFLNTLGLFLSFHVPCGSTYYQTGLCYRPLSRDFTSETHVSQPISSETELTREIQVKCDGLAGIRILIFPSAPGDQGITHFVLHDSTGSRTLLDASVLNEQITTENWYPLEFKPDWHSAGKQYTLTISNTGTAAGQGLKFLYTPQSDFNLGDFYENGVLLEEDLVLQYGCAAGLRKIWLTGQVLKP